MSRRAQRVRRRAIELLERGAEVDSCNSAYDLWYRAGFSAAAVALADDAYFVLYRAHLDDLDSPGEEWQTLCAAAACLLRQGWEPEL